jgi:hypothetical protein
MLKDRRPKTPFSQPAERVKKRCFFPKKIAFLAVVWRPRQQPSFSFGGFKILVSF